MLAPPDLQAQAQAYEHVGIRVSQRERSLAFYAALGFTRVTDLPEVQAAELHNGHGVGVNLIFNGAARDGAHNLLQDEPVRWPGLTHAAFVVPSLAALQAHLQGHSISITEGPLRIGSRRVALFIRDPDGNVLEFNELLPEAVPSSPH